MHVQPCFSLKSAQFFSVFLSLSDFSVLFYAFNEIGDSG